MKYFIGAGISLSLLQFIHLTYQKYYLDVEGRVMLRHWLWNQARYFSDSSFADYIVYGVIFVLPSPVPNNVVLYISPVHEAEKIYAHLREDFLL